MNRNAKYNLNLIATVIVALVGIAAVAMADDATLRDGVRVDGDSVTLGDIADLNGNYAQSLADVEVATFANGQSELKLNRLAVRQQLTDAGVHWGKLSLRGLQSIRITRTTRTVSDAVPAETVSDTVSADDPGAASANPLTVAVEAAPADVAPNDQTLKQAITDWIIAATGEDEDDLRIVYQNELDQAWSLQQGIGRFEIEPQTSDTVGRMPFSVRRYAGEQLTDTEQIRVDVLVRRPVLVIARQVRRGQVLTDRDLRPESRWLESLDPMPAAADVNTAVGQQADRTMKPGHIVRADDLTPPQMVKRGQLLTVRAISGGLVIRTVARANESGHLNQLIEARNPKTRDVFHVRVTGPQEAVMVIERTTTAAALPGGTS
jgi:flagella basal body P-ring formation protein FlgA